MKSCYGELISGSHLRNSYPEHRWPPRSPPTWHSRPYCTANPDSPPRHPRGSSTINMGEHGRAAEFAKSFKLSHLNLHSCADGKYWMWSVWRLRAIRNMSFVSKNVSSG